MAEIINNIMTKDKEINTKRTKYSLNQRLDTLKRLTRVTKPLLNKTKGNERCQSNSLGDESEFISMTPMNSKSLRNSLITYISES